jgi:hypothetical protein
MSNVATQSPVLAAVFSAVKDKKMTVPQGRAALEEMVSKEAITYDEARAAIDQACSTSFLEPMDCIQLVPQVTVVVTRGSNKPPAWEFSSFTPKDGHNAGKKVITIKFTGPHSPQSLGKAKLATIHYCLQNDAELVKFVMAS